ncbi:MAG TPA: DUF1778 domain-containing protein [Oceanithermus profundus]|uniref:DUF1778 domain-containing protein n=1 Tax=Oceanithermus profundus TaxID=187137 RepID=A0A7C4VGV2_9DEIN|nr:DUF1778 domain-containing protein [Oceanithermus profundus]
MKTARLDVRLDPEQKKLIEEAAALSGSTTSSFVQAVLLEKARTVIREHRAVERMVLSAEAFDQLVEDLEKPARIVPELLEQLGKAGS